jgi:hypothetical protein
MAVCFFCLRSREPSYNGRTLGEWLDVAESYRPPAERAQARQAVLVIGTNAFPQLLKWATTHSIVEDVLRKYPTIPAARKIVNSAERSRERADVGFGILWKEAVPTVQTLMTNSEPELRKAATNAMHVIRVMQEADEHAVAQ